jgi:hypothetical protein
MAKERIIKFYKLPFDINSKEFKIWLEYFEGFNMDKDMD